MEVKSGYKQTEVGVIPEVWKLTPFITLGSVIDGDRGTNYPSDTDFSSDGYCLFLNAGNVTKEGFRFSDCAFVTREKDDSLSKGKLKRNDIVLTTRGTVGNFAHFESAVAFEHVRINSGMVILRNESVELDNAFLYALLQSHFIEKQIERLTFGSAQPQLTVKGINEFWIIAPPLPEQRAIATALSDVDGLLGGLDRLIAKKRDLKQAAMQQLLTGQTRLPGFHGEWEIASLQQLVVKATGSWGATSPDERYSRFADIIRAGDISPAGELTATAPRYLSEAEFAKASCQPDDLVITTSGNGLGKVWWCDGRTNVAASNFVRLLRPIKMKAKGRFLSYVLRSSEALRQLREHTATSAYPNLRSTFFLAPWISLPPIPEQTAIAEVLTDMDAELAGLEQRLKKTRALKQAMMQELLTGKIRLIGKN